VIPYDFDSFDAALDRLLGFQDYDQAMAESFEWKSTREDLYLLLERLKCSPAPLRVAA
jgi:hypothetical protein